MDRNFLDPEITPTAKCHTCGEVILWGIDKCSYCGIELDQQEMFINAVNSFVITQACSSANTIRAFDPAAAIFLLSIITRIIFEWPLWFDIAMSLVWLGPILMIAAWFSKHGRWDASDPEYESARKAMKSSLKLWLAVNTLNAIAIAGEGLIKVE